MREIIFDTETTGLDPAQGHRVIEIGCVELIDGRETGQTYQAYLNPERPVDPDASAVSGLTDSFLRDKPIFRKSWTSSWPLSVKTVWWRITPCSIWDS